MSLKAKIEAVIYAAEEPVTLLQLAGLLGGEAQLELDRRAAAQQTLALEPGTDPDSDPEADAGPEALNAETLGPPEPEPEPDPDPGSAIDPATSTEGTDPPASNPEAAAAADPNPTGPASGQGSTLPTPNPDDRQLARDARDRDARLRDFFRDLLDQLIHDYSTSDRGLEIREVAGGYRLATKPEYHDAVRGFVKGLKPPLKLSLQALETLAVVAYKQPVTAPEVSEIRGVDSGGVLGSLMARKLVTTAGRKQVIGRPILYKTTKDFLLRFGLRDINELPSIEEFEKMAGELADQDPIQEQIPMQDTPRQADPDAPCSITGANLEEERDATEPQADGDSTRFDNAAADDMDVDGRLSGLPPTYDDGTNSDADSPAQDAEIQRDAESSS